LGFVPEALRILLQRPPIFDGIDDYVETPFILNSLTADLSTDFVTESRDEFDLKRYEKHIQAHIQDFPLSLGEIPPLSRECGRKDLIWRFIAAIFLDHAGIVDVWQENRDVMVIKHEADRERQDVHGELEEPDGIERPLGGIEA
jgi:hypothetical protein